MKQIERLALIAFVIILGFFSGEIGYVRLNQPYKRWWRIFWFFALVWVLIKVILFPFFRWWGGIVGGVNQAVWG